MVDTCLQDKVFTFSRVLFACGDGNGGFFIIFQDHFSDDAVVFRSRDGHSHGLIALENTVIAYQEIHRCTCFTGRKTDSGSSRNETGSVRNSHCHIKGGPDGTGPCQRTTDPACAFIDDIGQSAQSEFFHTFDIGDLKAGFF